MLRSQGPPLPCFRIPYQFRSSPNHRASESDATPDGLEENAGILQGKLIT